MASTISTLPCDIDKTSKPTSNVDVAKHSGYFHEARFAFSSFRVTPIMTKKIAILPGDGIGPEIVAEAVKVLECLRQDHGLDIELEHASVGGAAYDAHGTTLPDKTLALARAADAILLGAVGGPKGDQLDTALRPEKALLRLRSELVLFSNLRPTILYPQLADASSLKAEVVADLDIMIVRELTGGIYFGQPRGVRTLENGERQGYNTLVYSESEIKRIAHSAFRIAGKRSGRLCSVDKANVLESSVLWREVVTELGSEYPDVTLSHMYVDNAAMQLVRAPKQFDVIVTGNMFGDILSDAAAMLTGSIGMLPSASLDTQGKGLYEPVHGSAPDITGQGLANPLATILSTAMLLRYSLDEPEMAKRIERATSQALDVGLRTVDIFRDVGRQVSTSEMGDAVVQALAAN
jgi:3-isopropylmalate dehydrogenase